MMAVMAFLCDPAYKHAAMHAVLPDASLQNSAIGARASTDPYKASHFKANVDVN
jgi:hypothetical protein